MVEGVGEDLQAGFFTNIILLDKMLVLPPTSFFCLFFLFFFVSPVTWAREFTVSWKELRSNLVT